jgi:hypothetical protein
MTFNNIFNFGFSPSIKETYFEQFLALIFSFASSFTRTSQSLFPSLYGTDNFLALVSFPLSSVLCVVFVAAAAAAAEEEEEEDDDGITCFLLTIIFLDDDDTRRFVVPFNNEGEEEEEGEYEYSNLVVVVVIILVVKLVVIVPQKACVIKTFCVCVCVCVLEDKKKCVVFPSFCKEQNRQKKKKILFVGKKI